MTGAAEPDPDTGSTTAENGSRNRFRRGCRNNHQRGKPPPTLN